MDAPSLRLSVPPFGSRTSRRSRFWRWAGTVVVAAFAAGASSQIVVDDVAERWDDDLSDGVCRTCAEYDDQGNCVAAGGCTLFAAIQNANLTPGSETLTFAVSPVPVVELELPWIESPLIIDGTVGTSRVQIVGEGGEDGLRGLLFVGAPGSEVRNVDLSGLSFPLQFDDSPGARVQGCVLRDNTGSAILMQNSEGAVIGGDRSDPHLRNVIIGNHTGISLQGAGGHSVLGNLIGVDETGQPRGNRTGITIGAGGGDGTVIGSDDPDFRNVISNSEGTGVNVSGTGLGTSEPVRDVTILGNYIGTDPTGRVAAGNGRGIVIGRSVGIVVGRLAEGGGNLISGNGDGIWLNHLAASATVQGNTVGLGVDGEPVPNENGVVIRGEAVRSLVWFNLIAGNRGDGVVVTKVNDLVPDDNEIRNNEIGGDTLRAAAPGNGGVGVRIVDASATTVSENHIEANGEHGVVVEGLSTRTVIASNHIWRSAKDGVRIRPFEDREPSATVIRRNGIGVDTTGARDGVGNGESGVRVQDVSSQTVENNEIGRNAEYGIALVGGGAHEVRFNTIGLDRDFTPVPNGESGIIVVSSDDNIIHENMIAANAEHGVHVRASENVWVAANGFRYPNAPFSARNGRVDVMLDQGASRNRIGNDLASAQTEGGNAFYAVEAAVVVASGDRNTLSGNQMPAGPIDLGDDGIDSWDPGDVDIGPNLYQNSPFVNEVAVFPGSDGTAVVIVNGELISAPSATYRVEVFSDRTFDRPTLYPRADAYLGAVEVTTDADGNAAFEFISEPLAGFPERMWVSATATDADGNTSELSGLNSDADAVIAFALRGLFEDPPGGEELELPFDLRQWTGGTLRDVQLRVEAEGARLLGAEAPRLPRPSSARGRCRSARSATSTTRVGAG
ncbi:right-handed parallel beta-helix repeat-containing protein [Rubrivirga marina]|uniref:Right handed beta helix domain-containing protein n=1 Tax=Rubrivirga marina TaxID=1196024 RepID=A0A271IZM9_9BACT|nr:right-handed parallel beta-helix repeat-containing protein [Rubrivirga marina]PAP76691.1 hypothetical protein BSZ37_09690 [Rubrivirga marina]